MWLYTILVTNQSSKSFVKIRKTYSMSLFFTRFVTSALKLIVHLRFSFFVPKKTLSALPESIISESKTTTKLVFIQYEVFLGLTYKTSLHTFDIVFILSSNVHWSIQKQCHKK